MAFVTKIFGKGLLEVGWSQSGERDKGLGGCARGIGQTEQDGVIARFEPARRERGKQSLPGQMARFDQTVKGRAGSGFAHGY